jgi:hypothetical protein
MMTSLRVFTAFCAMFVWVETCCADCSSLRALAQQHANDMAVMLVSFAFESVAEAAVKTVLSAATCPLIPTVER